LSSRFAAVGAAFALLAACSVDNRQLQLATGAGGAGQSGASAEGGMGNGATAGHGAGTGGDAGSEESTISLVDGCADLDTNQVPDCAETVVENSDFKVDVSKWQADDVDTSIEWDEQNAARDRPSGSALVASTGVIDAQAVGVALRAAQQCVTIDGSKLVIVYANAFVEPDQDEQGRAEVDVTFYDSANCAGPLSTTFSTPQPLDGGVGSWLTLKAGSVSSPSTHSAQVKLALLKPFRAATLRARFDNILVKVESTE